MMKKINFGEFRNVNGGWPNGWDVAQKGREVVGWPNGWDVATCDSPYKAVHVASCDPPCGIPPLASCDPPYRAGVRV